MSHEIVAVDIGGTHARFAIAEISDGEVVRLDEPVTLKAADYASLQSAWDAFGEMLGRELPRATAFERFCLSFGSVAGDIVLAQGGRALVIAGGLGLRIAEQLGQSGFMSRFAAKGRFQHLMETIPVHIITHRQPGLYGGAAAFAQEHRL